MGTNYAKPDDPDHEFVEHLLTLQSPKDEAVARYMDEMREMFKITGHALVDRAPRTPDRKIAIRRIHDACMASIAAIAINQEEEG